MAQTVILEEQTLTGFGYNELYGIYMNSTPALAEVVVGESYTILWDGVSYPCTGQDMSALGAGYVGLGNLSAFGGTGLGEPFILGYFGGGLLLGSFDTAESHTVGIYQGTLTRYNPNDAVILNYSQNPVYYEKVPKVWLTHPDSTKDTPVLVPFTYGEGVSKRVEPDFSAGDMAVPIPEGELVTELTVAKPEALLPENIRAGTLIAGIEGSFEGQAGGSTDGEEEQIPVLFVKHAIATSFPGYSSKSGTLQVSATIDGNSDIRTVLSGYGIREASSYNQANYAPWVSALTERQDYTVTQTDGLATVAVSQGWSGTASRYKAATIELVVCAQIPGIYTTEQDGVKTLVFDDRVTGYNGGTIPGNGTFTAVDMEKAGLTSLAANMFKGHGALETVLLPAGLKSIGDYGFYQCYALNTEGIKLPMGLTDIGGYAFYRCTGLSDIVFPDELVTIGNYAFYQCTGFVNLSLPDKLTTIGGYAFYNCTNLEAVTFPAGLTSIGQWAFRNCSKLTNLTFPAGLTEIGAYAFGNCAALNVMDFSRSTAVPALGANAFASSLTTLQIKVPAALYDQWVAAANWSTYAAYIEAV